MARKRMIDPSWLESQSLGKICRDARLFFFGLITLADDEGRLRGEPIFLRNMIFAYDEDITVNNIKTYLKDLQKAECIRCYTVDNYNYIDLPKWNVYQKIDRPSKSKLPLFPDNYLENKEIIENIDIKKDSTIDRRSFVPNRIEENRIEKNINVVSDDKSQDNLQVENKPLPDIVKKYDILFENWYKDYPRKSGKFKAYQYFKKILKENLATIEQLTLAVKNYNADLSARGVVDEQYIKMADTFLSPSGRRWQDYLQQRARAPNDDLYFAKQGLIGSNAKQEPTVRDEKQMEKVSELFTEMPKHLRRK